MLYVGMVLGLVSAVLYVRRGAREIRARDARADPGKPPK
jgi:F0F1-type ATP synthase assembly protein I